MTVLQSESLLAVNGPLKTINITLPTPLEHLKATPEYLPTSLPSVPQISIALAESDLPKAPAGCTYSACGTLSIGLQNASGSTQYVTYNIYLNSEQIYNSRKYLSGGTNKTYYYSFNYSSQSLMGLKVGDVITVKLFCDASDVVTWDRYAFTVAPTRVIFYKRRILTQCSASGIMFPTLSIMNYVSDTSAFPLVYRNDIQYSTGVNMIGHTGVMICGEVYGTGRLGHTDAKTLEEHTSSLVVDRYTYYQQQVPTVYTFRPTAAKV